ncbi:MAG: hypothetical protein KAW92_13845 [Candidatus Cloacimonetes bacterium]|nr:hypothetical protein [Candidatus Cloacimonadota bacterium]
MKQIIKIDEEKGFFNYLVTWQSLDGRLEMKYEEFLVDAMRRCDHLKSLKRKPQLWAFVKLETKR